MKRSSSHKRRWGTLIEAAKAGRVSRLIGRSRSEDSVCNSHCRDNSHSHSNSPASDENGTESPTDSNPSLEVPQDQEIDLSGHVVTVGGHAQGHSHTHSHSHTHTHSQPPEPERHESHHGLGALAALRRKRKKFSASRNQSPVVVAPNPVEHAIAVCIGKANKKVWLIF